MFMIHVNTGRRRKSKKEEPPIEITCEGATNTSGCVSLDSSFGRYNLEIDGVRVLSNVTVGDIESYFLNENDEISHVSPNDVGMPCCPLGYVRSVVLPPVPVGGTFYIPIALTPDGESITSPITVGENPNPRQNAVDQLNAQLQPYGFDAVYGVNASTTSAFGCTYYNAKDYSDSIFYILDEGNTFPNMVRGLPSANCWDVM